MKLSTRDITSVEAIVRDSVNYMYIVNTENPIGWVILSNEKRYPTIIAQRHVHLATSYERWQHEE